MAQVRAFGALRYTDKGKTALNVCPPYDIISEEQRLGSVLGLRCGNHPVWLGRVLP